MNASLVTSLQTAVLLLSGSVVLAQQPSAQQHVIALKTSLATSQTILKDYEWVETTVINMKGEEKSRQMNRCYHGADGQLQKVPLTTPPPADKKRGVRGKVVENKTAEMSDYMKAAVALVKSYVPPQPAMIQAAKDAGKLAVQPLAGNVARLTFTDYLKVGDSFALELDLANNRPVSAKINSYLDTAADPVGLVVQFGTLDNNATYAANITLDAPSQKLQVVIDNSGYRRP